MLPTRRGALPGVMLLLGAMLAACSTAQTDATASATGDSQATASADGASGASPSASAPNGLNTGGALEITASDEAFDSSVIQAAAGESFAVLLINNDGDEDHNFAVYTEEGGDLIVASDIIAGGETVEVQVPALDAGEYYFVCQLHDEMNGTLIVEG